MNLSHRDRKQSASLSKFIGKRSLGIGWLFLISPKVKRFLPTTASLLATSICGRGACAATVGDGGAGDAAWLPHPAVISRAAVRIGMHGSGRRGLVLILAHHSSSAA